MKYPSQPNSTGKELPLDLRNVLMTIGRGLGTVSVYGTEHPSVIQMVELAFQSLQQALKNRKLITMGSFNGGLTIDEEPVRVRDIPIRTLETRLVAMKVSHLVLHKGLSRNELKQLFLALCAPTDSKMKEVLSGNGMSHVELEEVKYVALRSGEKKSGKSRTGRPAQDLPPAQVNQIIAFLKGKISDSESSEGLKKSLTDPEKLAQMIMEAATIRQSGLDVSNGESLADIVIGCLRRTYSGLRNEKEFQSIRGKANLSKAMMLLEKTVLDKIRQSLGARNPEIDNRIFEAIREMEKDRQFEMITSQYFARNEKMEQAEKQTVKAIQSYGVDQAARKFEEAGIPPKDWQRLMVQAGSENPEGANGAAAPLPGVDMSALAVVLEKLEGLMQMEARTPEEMADFVNTSKSGLENYTHQIESRIQELEGQVKLDETVSFTVEGHAEHLNREHLMVEISNLTLALIQPLTVVNASVESAITYINDNEIQKELLDLAQTSGLRMQTLSQRMMRLVGYPVLESTVN